MVVFASILLCYDAFLMEHIYPRSRSFRLDNGLIDGGRLKISMDAFNDSQASEIVPNIILDSSNLPSLHATSSLLPNYTLMAASNNFDIDTFLFNADEFDEDESKPSPKKIRTSDAKVIEPRGQLVIEFLKHEMKLSEKVLMRIILQNPSIFYLNVDRKLRPKLEYFRSLGFDDKQIRKIVSAVPSVLAMDLEESIPRKIEVLKSYFLLSKAALIKMITRSPFLLTCSAERNIGVSDFLRNTVKFDDSAMKRIAVENPYFLILGVQILNACWQLFTDVYGLEEAAVQRMCARYPRLLSRNTISKSSLSWAALK